jgi:chemotaxis methyl-accepting protein methylase
VRDLIESRCGLRFDDSQQGSLSSSVAARMQLLGLVNEDEYLGRLRGAIPTLVETELRHLLNLVTVTETCFFRDCRAVRPFSRAHRAVVDGSARRKRSRLEKIPYLERRLLDR